MTTATPTKKVVKRKNRLEKMQAIVDKAQHAKVERSTIDVQSAQLFVQCYSTTKSDKVKEAMMTLPLGKVMETIWKAVK